MLLLYKFANTARFAEEKKTHANVYFVVLLEEKMTAAAESDSTFARWVCYCSRAFWVCLYCSIIEKNERDRDEIVCSAANSASL